MNAPVNASDLSVIILFVVGGAVALGVVIALLVMAVKVTGGIIKGIFWLIAHVVRFVVDIVRDVVRMVSGLLASLVALPLAVCNVILARWPSAERWGRALKREVMIVGYSIFALAVRRPLQLFCLDGVLDGVEKRLPQDAAGTNPAVADSQRASGGFFAKLARSDKRASQSGRGPRDPVAFDGYDIEGTLRPGGSGAKLYVASPSAEQRRRLAGQPAKVVIKSFALEEGSSLPQIVRESRALDSARAMGLVLDHGLDDERFWYAMPYHPGDNLAETTRLLHARSGSDGLVGDDLREGLGYASDLVATLARYHEGGLWHKDVKPDNIIVHGGHAHLVDLGLVTPLRSAMTLTTHGTEYFRDPEMVRQALRGVRVHQVDGAKFDVYGAGAVLYFLLENTFPAHGGLSSFSRRSPESLRWIVRRAMADYHQRYSSARAMLDDLNAVSRAGDPWSVRPIDLPSMRGADMEGVARNPAGAWMPPPQTPPSSYANGPAVGAAAMSVSLAGRPKLKVTNWWTGAYASPDAADRARDAAVASKAARQVVESRRDRRPASPPPSRVGSAIGLAIPAFLFAMLWLSNGSKWAPSWFGGSSSGTSEVERTEDAILRRSAPPATLAAPVQGTKLLVVNDHPGAGSSEVDDLVNRIAGKWTERGFSLVSDDADTAAKVELALKLGDLPRAQTDLEAALAAGGYWGLLKIDAEEGEGPSKERLRCRAFGESITKAIAAAPPAKPTKKSKSSSHRSRSDTSMVEARMTAPEASKSPAPPIPPEPPLPPIAEEHAPRDLVTGATR
ncbi:MAG: hypothetical protein U0572_03190 [Phycisphaerales bacterium]